MSKKQLDKISKLLAMAESAAKIGSADEAAAFGAQAQALLQKHDLTMSDVELFAAEQEPISVEAVQGDFPFPLWKLQILKTLAEVNGCCQVNRLPEDQPYLAGRKRDREVTVNFFQYFVEAAERLESQLRTDYLQSMEFFTTGRLLTQEKVDAFLWGYASVVSQKLLDVYGRTNDDTDDVNPHALVFLEKREQDAREWLEEKGATIEDHEGVARERVVYDRDYVMAGAVAGDGVALTDKILG